MLESILKSVFSFMLVVLYCQKLLLPSVAILQEKKAEYSKLVSTVKSFNIGKIGQEKNRLKVENNKIERGYKIIQQLVPPFNDMKSNIERKFDNLKANIKGTWKIEKSPTFVAENGLIKWHYKLSFTGSFSKVIKAVAMLEGKGQLLTIDRIKIDYKTGDIVELETDVDLIFLDTKDGEKL